MILGTEIFVDYLRWEEKMQKLVHMYDRWRRTQSGVIVVEYIIRSEGEKYTFPTLEILFTKADELFLSRRQVPKRIVRKDWCISFVFAPKTFPTQRDQKARDKFFQWVIDNSKPVT